MSDKTIFEIIKHPELVEIYKIVDGLKKKLSGGLLSQDRKLVDGKYEILDLINRLKTISVSKRTKEQSNVLTPKLSLFRIRTTGFSFRWSIGESISRVISDLIKDIDKTIYPDTDIQLFSSEEDSFMAPFVKIDHRGEIYTAQDLVSNAGEENPVSLRMFLHLDNIEKNIKKEMFTNDRESFIYSIVDDSDRIKVSSMFDLTIDNLKYIQFTIDTPGVVNNSLLQTTFAKKIRMALKRVTEIKNNISTIENIVDLGLKIYDIRRSINISIDDDITASSYENIIHNSITEMISTNLSCVEETLFDPANGGFIEITTPNFLAGLEGFNINDIKDGFVKFKNKIVDGLIKTKEKVKVKFNEISKFSEKPIWNEIDKNIDIWFRDPDHRDKLEDAKLTENTFRDDVGVIYEKEFPKFFEAQEAALVDLLKRTKTMVQKLTMRTDQDLFKSIKSSFEFKDDGIDNESEWVDKAMRSTFFKSVFEAANVDEMYLSEAIYKSPIKPDAASVWMFVENPDSKPTPQPVLSIVKTPQPFRKFTSSYKVIAENLKKKCETFLSSGDGSVEKLSELYTALEKLDVKIKGGKGEDADEYVKKVKTIVDSAVKSISYLQSWYEDSYNFIPAMYTRIGNVLIFCYTRMKQHFNEEEKKRIQRDMGQRKDD